MAKTNYSNITYPNLLKSYKRRKSSKNENKTKSQNNKLIMEVLAAWCQRKPKDENYYGGYFPNCPL
jgi:hypothetical protein